MTPSSRTSPGFGRHGSVPTRLAATGWDVVRCLEPGAVDAAPRRGRLHRRRAPAGDGGSTSPARRGLKGVLKHGVGTDNIDIAACTARGRARS